MCNSLPWFPEEMPDYKEPPPPRCHFLPMKHDTADDGAETVSFWECRVCGHTKEESRWLSG